MIMVKIAKAPIAAAKPPLSSTVSAVLSDFVGALADQKILDDASFARLKTALLQDQSADAASLSTALFDDDEK